MKKLFALVLSLALVVAFAVPALATGWATLDPAPVYKEIGIAVYGLETTPNTSKVGELYAELKTTYPVVKGTTLHFLVELTVPYANLSDAVKELIKVKGLDVKIATTNMTISKVELGGGNAWSLNADKDTITETYTNPNYHTSSRTPSGAIPSSHQGRAPRVPSRACTRRPPLSLPGPQAHPPTSSLTPRPSSGTPPQLFTSAAKR